MRMLTVTQTALGLGASTQMVLRWIRHKQLVAEKVGTMYLVHPTELKRFRRPTPGRPTAVWFLWSANARQWHCTRRMTENENGVALCGKPLDLTGTARIERAGKPITRGDETLCSGCLRTWTALRRRVLHRA